MFEKEGKANRSSESKKILLGHYIRLGQGSQEPRVCLRAKQLRHGKQINRNFGIKSLLSQNWGHVFTPKFRKKNAGILRLPKLCPSRNQLHEDRY